MRVLWFTPTPSLYDKSYHVYHGGGWIESLETLIKEKKDVELGISFFHKVDNQKRIRGGTSYYPIKKERSIKRPVKSVFKNWQGGFKYDDLQVKDKMVEIIEDFQPDIIQVFGTEEIFATIQEHVDLPVIIHLQGLINPYLNAYFPPYFSKWDFLTDINFLGQNIKGISPFFREKKFRNQAKREKKILRSAKYVMGRTHWDRLVAELFNPEVKYFHLEEVLRPPFYNIRRNTKQDKDQISLVSTISSTVYKGLDLILKTAHLLKEETDINFTWKVIGMDNQDVLLRFFEKSLSIYHEDVNVDCVGKKNSEDLVNILDNSNLYIHPSYIENSPNSICEAQMVGLPVIATNVGGTSSIIENQITGILVPANGVFELAHFIKKYVTKYEDYEQLGNKARLVAQKRHDREKIFNRIMNIYSIICS